MRLVHRFRQLSLAVRIPVIVALLMALISLTLSERVLNRLSENQQSYLQGLASSYLDGVAASVSPSVLRQDIWEVYDILQRMKPREASVLPQETIVTTPDDTILASDRPERHPTLQAVGNDFLMEFDDSRMRLDTQSELGFQMRPIVHRGETIGKVFVVFDASSLLEERSEVLLTLLLTNGLLTLVFAGIGFLTVRLMVRPMQVLERHLQTATSGGLEPISDTEFPWASQDAKRMFSAFNRLVRAEREREHLIDRLTREERLGSLGRLASGMAHEINNPLGGLLNATDTLEKHGHHDPVRSESIDLIRRGLLGIRDVVQAVLATYRPERVSRKLNVQDLDDVALLLRPELKERSQSLRIKRADDWSSFDELPAAPMRQAIMNLLLNASHASPRGTVIELCISRTGQSLNVEVRDQGDGLSAAAMELINAPLTSRVPEGLSGLGLWVVRQISDELNATFSARANHPRGSIMCMTIPRQYKEELDAAA